MSFTVEQKNQLAKLMATENLTIQHQKIHTAKFDPKNRVLYLPIWQNMNGEMYDLLCGHEVGHALYTPAEGWHDVATDKSKGKNYKSFVNVVEDARIEKKVQRKYPGLRRSFKIAYQELMNRNFFGINDRDVNTMSFINRLNIFTKSQYTLPISFNDEETALLEKVKAVESWDDVIRVVDEIYQYSKDEQFEMMNDFEQFVQSDSEDDSEMESAGDETESNETEGDETEFSGDETESAGDETQADETEDSETQSAGDETEEEPEDDSEIESEKGSGDISDDESEDDAEDETDEEDEVDSNVLNRDKESQESDDDFDPRCETDEEYRKNEFSLLDEKSKDYTYVGIPKPILENIIVPFEKVHQQISDFYNKEISLGYISQNDVQKVISEFKNKNERYVALLAKEFEMQKAAKSYSKNKISDTGDVDVSKLASYQFDDNIFRKIMTVPKGKSHGLILLLDYSGSMNRNMGGSIEQILVLSMFCRKVNIPFIVYSFTDHSTLRKFGVNSFSQNENELVMTPVYMQEFMSSSMNNKKFTEALHNMILLKCSFEKSERNFRVPYNQVLGNTPLNQAIVAVAEVMKDFRKKNNLDITNLVIVHDGDSDRLSHIFKKTVNPYTNKEFMDSRYVNLTNENLIFVDRKYHFQMKFELDVYDSEAYNEKLLHVILEWFKKTTKSDVIGFFITDGKRSHTLDAIRRRYISADGKRFDRHRSDPVEELIVKQKYELLKSEKFIESHNDGYKSFYIVSGGGDLQIEDDELQIEGKITNNKLKNAFSKMNKKKQINRVLVSRFIQNIAA